MTEINIIAAIDENNLIGVNNKIPWYSSDDLKHFRKKTINNIVIMGRNTFESINKELPNRINCVITSKKIHNIQTFTNLKEALIFYKSFNKKIFIIGGSKLYEEAITLPCIKYLYLTKIESNIKVDENNNNVYFPNYNKNNFKFIKSKDIFFKYKNVNNGEQQYLNLLNETLLNGNYRQTRNSKTYSIFGKTLEFNLENQIPVLTTKRVFWKGVVEELLFFINGYTNTKKLSDKGIRIWEGNTNEEFLKKRKLNYNKGDMGPMYGFQLRHYGENYKGMDNDYKGFDQLDECIKILKNDPTSRRIIMTTYNPADVEKSVLPPCHGISIQFYVNDNKLDCMMHQRSADLFLGLPFNITSYSLLTYIIAKHVGLETGKLIITLGDAHIYDNHIDAVKEQLKRIPISFPKLEINNKDNIYDYIFEDFKLINYNCDKLIKAEMVA